MPAIDVSLLLNNLYIVMRTSTDPGRVSASVREQLIAVDRDVAASQVLPMEQVLAEVLAPRRFALVLLTGFAVAALLLMFLGFLRSGDVASLRIVRDFESQSRLIERAAPTPLVEWVSPREGWVRRNGELRRMSGEELAVEIQGLKQEPYSIYHRLAENDPALRVELRENDSVLYAYDADERVLCWFQLDGKGGLVGWGNFFDGSVNQHHYGPIADMGDVNLPRWGAASNGSFRFEYVSARMRNTPENPPRAESVPLEHPPSSCAR
jgi:hypothetical protein